VVVREGRDMLV